MSLEGPLNVRVGTIADADEIIALYQAESTFVIGRVRLLDYLEALPSAVAWAGTQLVGFAFCVPCSRDIVELGNILVKAGYRGSGLGGRLLLVVEELAAARFHTVMAINSMLYDTIAGKRPAANFYLRNGYTRVWTTGPTDVFMKAIGPA